CLSAFLSLRPPPSPSLFPYTTLFRSEVPQFCRRRAICFCGSRQPLLAHSDTPSAAAWLSSAWTLPAILPATVMDPPCGHVTVARPPGAGWTTDRGGLLVPPPEDPEDPPPDDEPPPPDDEPPPPDVPDEPPPAEGGAAACAAAARSAAARSSASRWAAASCAARSAAATSA